MVGGPDSTSRYSTGSLAPDTSIRPRLRPDTLTGSSSLAPTTPTIRPQPRPLDLVQASSYAQGPSPLGVVFPPITRDALMGAIEADNGPDGLASKLEGKRGPANRKKFEEIADLCIKIGNEENVDPRILFAMAMQESDCGLNTRHSSSATGVTGMKPSSAPDASARRHLNDPETCLRQTARYLKGQIVREMNAPGRNHGVSAADLAPGNNNDNTAKILLAYRYGAGGANSRLRSSSIADLRTTSDYSNVFRHMRDMGL